MPGGISGIELQNSWDYLGGSVQQGLTRTSRTMRALQDKYYKINLSDQLGAARRQMLRKMTDFNRALDTDPKFHLYPKKWDEAEPEIYAEIAANITNRGAAEQFEREFNQAAAQNRVQIIDAQLRKQRTVGLAVFYDNIADILSEPYDEQNVVNDLQLRSAAIAAEFDRAYANAWIDEALYITEKRNTINALERQVLYTGAQGLYIGRDQAAKQHLANKEYDQIHTVDIAHVENYIRNQDFVALTPDETQDLIETVNSEVAVINNRIIQIQGAVSASFENDILTELSAENFALLKADNYGYIRSVPFLDVKRQEHWIDAIDNAWESLMDDDSAAAAKEDREKQARLEDHAMDQITLEWWMGATQEELLSLLLTYLQPENNGPLGTVLSGGSLSSAISKQESVEVEQLARVEAMYQGFIDGAEDVDERAAIDAERIETERMMREDQFISYVDGDGVTRISPNPDKMTDEELNTSINARRDAGTGRRAEEFKNDSSQKRWTDIFKTNDSEAFMVKLQRGDVDEVTRSSETYRNMLTAIAEGHKELVTERWGITVTRTLAADNDHPVFKDDKGNFWLVRTSGGENRGGTERLYLLSMDANGVPDKDANGNPVLLGAKTAADGGRIFPWWAPREVRMFYAGRRVRLTEIEY